MRVMESGRFVHAAGATVPRRFLETHLASLHGRFERLRAIAGAPHVASRERDAEPLEALHAARALHVARDAEWLLLRDYDGNGRERSVIFFFRDGKPSAVVKVRAREAAGATLATEANALHEIAPRLDASLRATVPRVEDFVTTEAHELLVLSALPGRSLSILMQRSLRPRTAHVGHLLAAARWLGKFHRSTGAAHGDFWPRNILFDESGEVSGVVDWEHASIGGQQWNDVLLLARTYVEDAPAWFGRNGAKEMHPAVDAYLRTYSAEVH